MRTSPSRLVLIVLIVGALAARLVSSDTGPTVTLDSGPVQGAESHGVLSFKGIPYAAPPIGPLRWRPPQTVASWREVRRATSYGHDCMQLVVEDQAAPPGAAPSEDCLVLNVWRPADIPSSGLLPVMVWIHGGGYVNGGSSAYVYDGQALARRGLVVVSFNYRLGRLGFFAHPALIAAKEGLVGNFGYLDQIAALRWVRVNIGKFGGDSARVTLVGESAGGASILHLITSPAVGNLFQQAVVMSGGGRRALVARPMAGGTTDRPSADQSDAAFARSLGIAGTGLDALAALRALPARAVIGDVSLPALFGAAILTRTQAFPGTPMIDGAIVTAEPGDILSRSGHRRVPIVVGTTAQDLPLHFPAADDLFSYFGADAGRARVAYGDASPSHAVVAVGADMTMHEPARFVARAMTGAGRRAWLYRFTYVAEGMPERARGASHTNELPYLFDTIVMRYGPAAVTAKDRHMSRDFSAYIANFVRTGDPNETGLPKWPKFRSDRFDVMNFTLDDGPVFGRDPRAARIELVERAADRHDSH